MSSSSELRRHQNSAPRSRGLSRKSVVVAGLLSAGTVATLWTTAVIATVHTMGGSDDIAYRHGTRAGLALMLHDPALAAATPSKTSRPPAPPAVVEAAKMRIAAAVARTDDAEFAVLPDAMSLASVDKSDRLDWSRAGVSPDEQALAVLKKALARAEGERVAKLALAAELEKEQAVLAKAQMMASAAATNDELTTGSVPAATGTATALAYAAPTSARETVDSALVEDAFGEVLAGGAEMDDGLPEDGPLPAARPRLAVPAAKAEVDQDSKSAEKPARSPLLSYAKPSTSIIEEDDDRPSIFGRKAQAPGRGSRIAVYDISAGVVHMPNGERLEAHSGRGSYRDNPKYVHVKNRGSTPPNVYNLRMRESRFHGVEAIRMTPVGDAKMYGRDGFLTHTYLLRVRGDSSGCVVFNDYNRFLKAFKRGEVKTLIVVPRMADLNRYMAML